MTTKLDSQRQRFEADPSDARAFQFLEEHYFLEGAWEQLVELYRARVGALDAESAPRDRAGVLFRFGQALEEGFSDLRHASDCYREALELDPELEPARRRLRQVHLSQGEFASALDLLDAEARRTYKTERRVRVFMEIGELCLGKAADPARAVEAYESVLRDEPDNTEAIAGRARALEALGMPDAAQQTREEAAEQLDGEPQAEAFEELLANLDPNSEEIVATYWRAHTTREGESHWIEGLARHLIERSRYEEAAALGDARIERAENGERRAEIAIETGRIAHQHLDDAATARRWFALAAEWSESPELHIALAELAVDQEDDSLRASHLARAMELDDGQHQVDTGAAPVEPPSAFTSPERAEAAPAAAPSPLDLLRERAEAAPEDPSAQRTLSEGLESAGRYSELVEVLERRLAFSRDGSDERAELLYRIGELRERELQQPEAAADAFQMCFAIAPEYPCVIEALERVLRGLGQIPELASLLEQAAAAESRNGGALFWALGKLRRDELDDLDGALDAFANALLREPGHPEALETVRELSGTDHPTATRLRAIAAEIKVGNGARLAEIVPDYLRLALENGEGGAALAAAQHWTQQDRHSRVALEALAEILSDQGDTEALVDTLERLETCVPERERGAVRRRLGYLHAAEGRPEGAIEAWRSALDIDPDDAASAEALIDGLWESERASELVALFEGDWEPRVRGVRNGSQKFAGALETLGRLDDALSVHRRLCAAAPNDSVRSTEFERVARAADAPEALAEALALRIAQQRGAGERDAMSLERAILLDTQLNRRDEARAVYAELAERAADEGHRSAADTRLVALLEAEGEFRELCEHLERRCDGLAAEEACETHARVAQIAETRLRDLDRARRHLELALALRPDRGDLWRRLGDLYDEDTQANEVLRAIEGELASNPSSDRLLPLQRRAGLLCAERDPEAAERYFAAVIEIDPAEPEAAAFLVARFDATARTEESIALLRRQLETLEAKDDDAARARRIELRLALAARLPERSEDAIAILEPGLAEARADEDTPFSRVAESLAERYRDTARIESYYALCEEVAERSAHPAETSRWWERCAQVAQDQGARDTAIDAFERALHHAPQPETIRAPLIEIHRDDRNDERLAELLEEELGVHPESETLLRELADLYEGPLAVPERALVHLEALTALDPHTMMWWERALSLARAEGNLEQVLGLLRGAAEFGPTAQRREAQKRVAHLLRDELERPEEAIQALRDALGGTPEDGDTRRELRELLFAQGHDEAGYEVLWSEVERSDAATQLSLVEQALEMGQERPVELQRPWIARLQALAGERSDILQRAARAYAAIEDDEAHERALALAARSMPEGRELCALHLERASLLAHAGERPRRIAALEEARRLGADNRNTLHTLETLYRAERRFRELLEVLEVQLANASERDDGDELRVLKLRVATLCATEIAEPERATELWCELLEENPELLDPSLRGRVSDLLRSAGAYRQWAPLAELELAVESEGSPRWLDLTRDLAALYDHQLGQASAATRHYRNLSDRGACNERERRALLRLLLSHGAAREWTRRVEAHLEREAGDTQAWIALARVREEYLSHTASAAEAYARAVELDDTQSGAWSGVRRTHEKLGAWAQVADATERLIALEAIPAGPSWRSVGELAFRRLSDLPRARRALQRARERQPEDLESLRLLREVAICEDELSECAQLYREEIELLDAQDPALRELWIELAALAGGPLCDWERCAEAYACADALEALDPTLLEHWCEALLAGEGGAPTERWAQVFERWCEHPDTEASALDHERLARVWAEVEGETRRAARQIERALELDPNRSEAWVLAAELRGDTPAACEAWRRAAECSSSADAARFYVRAASLVEGEDDESAWSLFCAAAEVDPSAALALAGLARVGEATGRSAPAADAAERLLNLEIDTADYPKAIASGARCAAERATAAGSDRGAWEQARALCDALLEEDAANGEASWIRARALFALGERRAARGDFETRMAQEPPLPGPERAVLLEQLGLCLATLGERGAAVARLRETLEIDEARGEAHRTLCETLETMGRRGEAASAWAHWANAVDQDAPSERASRFERAARLGDDDDECRETWLRAANRVDSAYAPTRLQLIEELFATERFDEALDEAQEGIAHLPDGSHVARIESFRGRILEKQRNLDDALEAYRRAIELNPSAIEDARAAGRLLRGRGDWEGAAAMLRSFTTLCPQDSRCGEALLDLGRLLAGPLEDIPSAVEVYRRARDLAPEREDIRESLADLLAQFPEYRDEAVAEHRALLRTQPLRQRSLRALLTIAEREGKAPRIRHGKALLGALGFLTTFEQGEGVPRLEFQIGRKVEIGGDLALAVQKAAHLAAPFCESLLPEHEVPEARKRPVEGPLASFREAFFVAETDQLGAGWLALPPEALREVLGVLIRAHEEGGEPCPALEEATGRVRRRVRKALSRVSLGDLEGFDVASWQTDLELQALSIAVDVTGGAIRPALLYTLANASDNASLSFGDEVELGSWVEAGGLSARLFERALCVWLDSF